MRTPRARGASRLPRVIQVSQSRLRRQIRSRTEFLFRAALDRVRLTSPQDTQRYLERCGFIGEGDVQNGVL